MIAQADIEALRQVYPELMRLKPFLCAQDWTSA
jgi:hypothetical protein